MVVLLRLEWPITGRKVVGSDSLSKVPPQATGLSDRLLAARLWALLRFLRYRLRRRGLSTCLLLFLFFRRILLAMARNLSGLCCALTGVARSRRVRGAKEHDIQPEADGNPCRALVTVTRSLPSVAGAILSNFFRREN